MYQVIGPTLSTELLQTSNLLPFARLQKNVVPKQEQSGMGFHTVDYHLVTDHPN